MSDSAEKKHAPTQRRRDKALQQGDSPKSPLLTAALVLFATAFIVCTFGSSAFNVLVEHARSVWGESVAVSTSGADLPTRISQLVGGAAVVILGVVLLAAVIAVLVQAAQFGGRWFPQLIELKWERISPATGASRIFSFDTLASLPFDLAKGMVLFGGVGYAIYSQAPALAMVGWREPGQLLDTGLTIFWHASLWCLAGLAMIGLAEYVWKRFRWEQRLRMSDQELREELREQNPSATVVREQRRRHNASSNAAASPVSGVDAQSPV